MRETIHERGGAWILERDVVMIPEGDWVRIHVGDMERCERVGERVC